jgi:hypothetical protein
MRLLAPVFLVLLLAACGSSQPPLTIGDAAAGDTALADVLAADLVGSPQDAAGPDVPVDLAPSPVDLAPVVADLSSVLPDVPSPFHPCLINADCDNPLACVFGRCHVACALSRDCPLGSRCVKGPSGQVCLLPSEDVCQFRSDCAPPLACAPDRRCRNECQASNDCVTGEACVAHVCVDPISGFDAGAGGPIDAPAIVVTDGATLWGLSRGKNDYRVTATTSINDGCLLSTDLLLDMTLPVSYDGATQIISVGNLQGTPPMPSLGSGRVDNNMATLARENESSDGLSCTYHRRDVAQLTLIGDDTFTLDVTEQQSMFTAQCQAPPQGGSCTSHWRWTLRKN